MIPIPLNIYVISASAALLAVFIYVASDVMGLFPSKNNFPLEGKTVLLTGGSQGMGLGLGKLLAQKGANVVIVARNKDTLASALKEITSHAKSPSQRFHSISADVSDPSTAPLLLSETTSWNHSSPPDIIWANAGAAHPTLFSETPISTLRSQMDLNYWGATYLSHAYLSHLLTLLTPSPDLSLPPRHIIFTSSVAAFVGLAGYTPYSPAKAALRNLADTLRNEVQLYNAARRSPSHKPAPDRDIKIHVVFPGTIISPGLENENKVKHPATHLLEEGDPKQTPDEVAAAAIRGLERGEFLVPTQWLGNVMKVGMMGGSPRGNVVLDTLLGWVVAVVWLFIGPDLDGRVWKWGKENGMGRREGK
ncbi:Short chain dehydrogenase-like protein 55 [Elsinoe fawcettii]|nr:Short chain dehydrogenase-like protein 55 [Elsinoe fawcettii]